MSNPSGAVNLLSAANTTGSSQWMNVNRGIVNIQAWLSNTTTPAATLIVEGSNEETPTNAVTIYTLSISGAAAALGRSFWSGYYWVRVRCSAITGTNATVSALGRVFE